MNAEEGALIDIPVGKALVPVETKNHNCKGCVFFGANSRCGGQILCGNLSRKDGKEIIFKLADWPVKEKQE